MSDLDPEPEDATSLSPEEREGLIPSHVALRRELNELEQENILLATTWAFSRRRDLYSEAFARGLHKRMFDRVWAWAGEYRRSDKNIGVPAWRIQTRLRQALDDARYWATNQTFAADESRDTLPPRAGLYPSVPEWEWALVALDGGPRCHVARGSTLQLGGG